MNSDKIGTGTAIQPSSDESLNVGLAVRRQSEVRMRRLRPMISVSIWQSQTAGFAKDAGGVSPILGTDLRLFSHFAKRLDRRFVRRS